MEDNKEILIKAVEQLKLKHESIKNDMLKILEATQLLDTQYKDLEQQLYAVEDEYINVMKELM